MMARVKEAIEGGTSRRIEPPTVATRERRYPRGAIVVVDDGSPFQGRIVAVIGVVAVIAHRRDDGAGEACRAVPVRCCRLAGDQPSTGGGRAR